MGQWRASGRSDPVAGRGVIRAQDITRTNTVTYEKIADAQISYLNSGDATSVPQRRAGQKALDWIVPF